MKNLLMIAYYYPPLGGVGALRPLQFSRYLSEFGWSTIVVSVSNDYAYTRDKSLMESIPTGQRIARAYRIPFSQTIRKFVRGPLRKYPLAYSFLDPQFDWVSSAVKTGLKLSKQYDIDAIYATAPPFSSIRVAASLSKKLRLPSIADIRDPFTTNFAIRWPSYCHKRFYQTYERRLLTSFDHIITVNETIHSDWLKSIGKLLPPVDVIPNGYDPTDFRGSDQLPSKDRFLIGYVGSIYGGLTALPFFKSLSLAMKQRPRMNDNLEVQFMGNINQAILMSDAQKCGVNNLVTYLGFKSHQEAVSLMQRCHVLLVFGPIVAPSVIPAKLFEYGASKRPVLSFSRPGALADFIEQNKYGFTVDWSQPDDGCHKIIELYDKWTNNEPICGAPQSNVERYSRRSLTKQLVNVLSQVTSQ